MAFSPGHLFGLARSYDRAGFCPRKFLYICSSKIHVRIVYFSHVVHFVLSSSKQTMLRVVGVLNTGCLRFVFIIVLLSTWATLLVTIVMLGFGPLFCLLGRYLCETLSTVYRVY